MKLKKKGIVGISLCSALALQALGKEVNKNQTNSLGTVDIISTTEDTDLYTVESMNTATKMNLSIKDTPQSVSVVTNKQIEDKGLTTLKDALDTIVGVSSGAYDSERINFSARGFDILNYQIDGISSTINPQWSGGESVQDLTIYDRIEVVRGANGLLSGSGDPSAAINLIRKHANYKEFKGKATLKAGSWNKHGLEVDLQGGLNERGSVRARAAASYEKKDSFRDYYSRKKSVAYGVIDADVSDQTQISAGISFQDNKPKGATWGGLPANFSDGSATNWDRSKSTAAKWTEFNSQNLNLFGNLEHYFKNDIKLNANYSQINSDSDSKLLYVFGNLDKNSGAGLVASPGRYDVEIEQDSFDVYASIPFEQRGLDQELVVGLSHTKQDSKAYGYNASRGSITNFYTWDGNYEEPTWGSKTLAYTRDLKQTGAYLAGNLSLSDSFKFVLGSRISNWEIDNFNLFGSNYKIKHTSIFTPYAGFVYDIDATYSAYASYTDIFKPQDKQDSSGSYLDPIVGKNYETGIKASFVDDKLNASFAIFRIEQDKLAQTDPSGALVPGTSTVASIASEGATSKGFEIEVNGSVTPLWNIGSGFSKFKAVDKNKKRVNTMHPRETLKLFTTYKLDNIIFGGGLNRNGKTYHQGTYKIEQGSYTLVNLMGRYEFTKKISAQVNLNNLFDKKYFLIDSFAGYTYGNPRNFTANLKYTF